MSEKIMESLITVGGTIIAAIIGAWGVIQAAKQKNTGTGETKLSLVWIILSGVIIGLAVGWVIGKYTAQENSNPFKPVQTFGFEEIQDQTDVKPWKITPQNKPYQLIYSNEQAHSGKSSLRLRLNFQPLDTDPSEHGGLALFSDDISKLTTGKIIACVAWVLIPYTESSQNNDLYSHIFGYTYDQAGNYLGIYGDDVKLVPGKWTAVYWTATYATELNNYSFESVAKKITELYITVWDYNNPYDGSIYFDDIVFYTIDQ